MFPWPVNWHPSAIKLVATKGTAEALRHAGLEVERVYKVNEGRPNVVDLVKSAKIDLIINTPRGRISQFDERAIRRAAVQHGVTCITQLSAAAAAVSGIRAQQAERDRSCEPAILARGGSPTPWGKQGGRVSTDLSN